MGGDALPALRDLLADPRVATNARHWRALAEGEVPDGWPLIAFVTNPSMATADGADHRRLRALVSQAFTPRRVATLRPDIERTVGALLDALAEALAEGPADLQRLFAYPLPLTVICDLLGFPVERRAELRRLASVTVSTVTAPADEIANSRALSGLLAAFVADRRAAPRDDLTSALIDAVTDEREVLSEAELVGTLATLLVAGHGTVTALLSNAVRALLADPGQLEPRHLRQSALACGDRGGAALGLPARPLPDALRHRGHRRRGRDHPPWRRHSGLVRRRGPRRRAVRRGRRAVRRDASAVAAPVLRPRRPLLRRRVTGAPGGGDRPARRCSNASRR